MRVVAIFFVLGVRWRLTGRIADRLERRTKRWTKTKSDAWLEDGVASSRALVGVVHFERYLKMNTHFIFLNVNYNLIIEMQREIRRICVPFHNHRAAHVRETG